MSEVTRHEREISDDARALVARCLAEADVPPGALLVPRASASAAIMLAIEAAERHVHAELFCYRFCRVCGCTDLRTCAPDDPCHWVDKDLCSACVPYVQAAQ